MRKILICIGVIILGLTACKKDIDLYIPGEEIIGNPDQLIATPANILNELRPEPKIYSWNTSQEYWIQTTGLTTLSFPANAFIRADGEIATGPVEAEIIEIFTKGDMILHNTPTTSNGRILESAGELFVNVTQDGNPLLFAPGKRMSVSMLTETVNPDMELFIGNRDDEWNLNWTEVDAGWQDSTTVFLSEVFDSTGNAWSLAYTFLSDHMQWLNVDALAKMDSANAYLCITLPDGYDNQNMLAYAVMHSINSVVQLAWDKETEKFCAGPFPDQEEITVVALSERVDGDYMLATSSMIVTDHQEISLTPSLKRPGDIAEFLSGL